MTASILYIEDEEDYQLLVRRILSKAGFELRGASSIQEGLVRLTESPPDLLILDVNLPDGDGYSLCRQLKNDPLWLALPILLLTVKRQPDEWIKGFASGADDYLPKPLNPPELVNRVQACLRYVRNRSRPQNPNAEYLLIQSAVAGNRSAFEILIEKYRSRLMDSLRASGKDQAEAEDITAETYALAYQRLDQFLGKSSFYTWIYRIAMNQSVRRYRYYPTHVALNPESSELMVADQIGEDLSRHVLRLQLKQAVSCVPKPYRQMLKWHFIRGLSYQTIARRLKIPSGTVMSRLFYAKQLFRQAWVKVGQSK
jgi:RNA polymerase sigma factor (sigma-70 family)